MAIKPFFAGNIDPDLANEKMEHWLAELRPFYLNSPEYQKLSKANKKAAGSWFDHFMFFFLNCIDENMKNLDADAAEEIMLSLYPDQINCSDQQVKTIVPELIAYWQFLHRELNQGKKQQLKHAPRVISFLQGIQKNYLQTFRQHEDNTESELTLEKLLTILGVESPIEASSDDNAGEWLNELIYDAAINLSQYKNKAAPPQHWLQLRELPLASLLIQHLCHEGIDPSLPNAHEAAYELLNCALQEVFMQVRQKDKAAIKFWHETEQTIIQSAQKNMLDPEGTNILVTTLTSHKQFLSEEFINFLERWNLENAPEIDLEEIMPNTIEESTRRMLEEIPDEFTLASVLNEQLAFMPAEGLELVSHILVSSTKGANGIALMALDNNPQRAQTVIHVLSREPKYLPPTSLARLIRIRNWLAKPVQKDVDKLIQAARKKGVVPSSPQPLDTSNILETHMTAVDGSGSQGVIMTVRDGSLYRLISFVLKESVGVIDVVVSPQTKKQEIQQYVSMLKKQARIFEKISLELIHKVLPFFLALNLKSGIAIDHELIQVMELLGIEDWNPNNTDLRQLYDVLLKEIPTTEEITAIQKRSKNWTKSVVGESWFEEPEREVTLQQIHSYSAFFDAVIEPAREKWGERMGRMALWAFYSGNKNRQKQCRDYAVVSWLLEHSKMPTRDISLLDAIARNSM